MSSLAAARADNFYYPRDFDPSKHNTLNQHNKDKGITKEKSTIRFEMMFNVKCTSCNNSIGKGVRFNAEKKVVGEYLSTKIYEFSMKCHLCSKLLKVRSDPKNCDYFLQEGLVKIRADTETVPKQEDKSTSAF